MHDGELEELLEVQEVIREIIFDQVSRTVFTFYSRDIIQDIPQATFTRDQADRDDIPEGPPDLDSDGHEILTDVEYSLSASDDSDSPTDDDA